MTPRPARHPDGLPAQSCKRRAARLPRHAPPDGAIIAAPDPARAVDPAAPASPMQIEPASEEVPSNPPTAGHDRPGRRVRRRLAGVGVARAEPQPDGRSRDRRQGARRGRRSSTTRPARWPATSCAAAATRSPSWCPTSRTRCSRACSRASAARPRATDTACSSPTPPSASPTRRRSPPRRAPAATRSCSSRPACRPSASRRCSPSRAPIVVVNRPVASNPAAELSVDYAHAVRQLGEHLFSTRPPPHRVRRRPAAVATPTGCAAAGSPSSSRTTPTSRSLDIPGGSQIEDGYRAAEHVLVVGRHRRRRLQRPRRARPARTTPRTRRRRARRALGRRHRRHPARPVRRAPAHDDVGAPGRARRPGVAAPARRDGRHAGDASALLPRDPAGPRAAPAPRPKRPAGSRPGRPVLRIGDRVVARYEEGTHASTRCSRRGRSCTPSSRSAACRVTDATRPTTCTTSASASPCPTSTARRTGAAAPTCRASGPSCSRTRACSAATTSSSTATRSSSASRWIDEREVAQLSEVRRSPAARRGSASATRGRCGWRSSLAANFGALRLGSPATNGRDGAGYGGLFWRFPKWDATVVTRDGRRRGRRARFALALARRRRLPQRRITVLLAQPADREPLAVVRPRRRVPRHRARDRVGRDAAPSPRAASSSSGSTRSSSTASSPTRPSSKRLAERLAPRRTPWSARPRDRLRSAQPPAALASSARTCRGSASPASHGHGASHVVAARALEREGRVGARGRRRPAGAGARARRASARTPTPSEMIDAEALDIVVLSHAHAHAPAARRTRRCARGRPCAAREAADARRSPSSTAWSRHAADTGRAVQIGFQSLGSSAVAAAARPRRGRRDRRAAAPRRARHVVRTEQYWRRSALGGPPHARRRARRRRRRRRTRSRTPSRPALAVAGATRRADVARRAPRPVPGQRHRGRRHVVARRRPRRRRARSPAP